MTRPLPMWADAEEVEHRFWEADPERHDTPEPEALLPEMWDDRCRICGQVVDDGLVECNACFTREDASARRREDR